MLGDLVPKVERVRDAVGKRINDNGVKTVVDFDRQWRSYRRAHLGHRLTTLTDNMAPNGRSICEEKSVDCYRDLRNDLVYSSENLAPSEFKESALGLSTELRSGTPLWVGLEGFVSRNTTSHNRPILLLDTLGWGVQVRLPIDNEFQERPVGVAIDLGPGLPVPLSELVKVSELQVYVGIRGRTTYTAQSVFEEETRHAVEIGFGGLSIDFIVGNTAWFGMDGFRKMYEYDFWENDGEWQPLLWSFSGGMAVNAF
jgi:hypothetical protein